MGQLVSDVHASAEFLALNVNGATSVGWVAYIIIGGIAGWLAGKFIKGRGQGILLNIVTGVIGAFAAGLVLNLLGFDVESGGYWFTFFIAFLGAAVLLWILSLVRKS